MTTIHMIDGVTVAIIPNDKRTPVGKLAEAEVHFRWTGSAQPATLAITYAEGQTEARATQTAIGQAVALDGLRLTGFAIWERRSGTGRNVTFPARQYAVNGERRSFALLRPNTDTIDNGPSMRLRDLIIRAYEQHEAAQSMPADTEPLSDDLFGSQANVDRWYAQPHEKREPTAL
jgi:hypothetical protein